MIAQVRWDGQPIAVSHRGYCQFHLTAALTPRTRWSPPLSLSLPHLRASLSGCLFKTNLQSGPSPQPRDAARHSVPVTDSRVPERATFPFQDSACIFSSGKHLPPLQALGKCHFSLSGIISHPPGLFIQELFPRCPGWSV